MEENKFASKNHYWSGFDYVKGILIIIVFMGHIIPGVLRETYPRYFIYSFHMPLFIGISGFLLNIEKLDMQVKPILIKYWKRIICPWIIAVTIFYLARNIHQISVKGFGMAFFKPYYHLWYVLGFLSYLIITCVFWGLFRNTCYKWWFLFGTSVTISFVSKWDLLSPHLEGFLHSLHEIVQYDFRLYNLIFFVLGIYLRNMYEHNNGLIYSKKTMEITRIVLIMSMMCVSLLFFFDFENIENMMFYVMNCTFLVVIIFDCVNNKIPESKIIEFIGKYSLPIYLYHILCKLVALVLFQEGTPGYYVVCIVGLTVGCILIKFLRRVKVINTVVFGTTT